MFMIYLVLTLLLWITAKHYLGRHRKFWEEKGIPSREPCPLFGNMGSVFIFRRSFTDAIVKFYNQFHDCRYVGFFQAKRPILLIRDYELAKNILVSSFNHFRDRTTSSINTKQEPMLHNITTMSGDDWKNMRHILTPLFTNTKLQVLYPSIQQSTYRLSNAMLQNNESEGDVLVSGLAARYVTDVIGNIAFGSDPNCLHEDSTFYKMAKKVVHPSFFTMIKRYCRNFPLIYRFLSMKVHTDDYREYFSTLLKNKIEEKQNATKKGNDYLQFLLDTINTSRKSGLSDDLILSNVYLFIINLETSTSGLIFTLYEIAKNPSIQNEIRKEIRGQIEKHKGLTYEAISEMKLLNNALHESLRLHPPVHMVTRQCTSKFLLPDKEVELDCGQSVMIPIQAFHRDAANFKCPREFDPKRFEDEGCRRRFLAFGDGPRGCLGMRLGILILSTAVSRIINDFSLECCELTPNRIKYDTRSFILTPKDGMWLRFRRLSKI